MKTNLLVIGGVALGIGLASCVRGGKAVALPEAKVLDPVKVNPDNEYQVTYPDWVVKAKQMRGVMSPTKPLTEDDFATLQKWNANMIRFQIMRNWGSTSSDRDLDDYDAWIDQRLENLDKVLEIAERNKVRVVVDMHSPAGGRIPGNEMTMFYDQKYADHFIEVWKKIAKRCKGKKALWGYDIINEPVQKLDKEGAVVGYMEIQRRAAKAIREIDPDTPLIVESNQWDCPAAFKYLEALEMPNVIYQVHMYQPGAYTHQGIYDDKINVDYPGMINGEMWNKERIKKELQPVRDFQLRHNCRIYVGEFSVISWAPHPERYLQDCIDVFEEYGWDYTYHAFREWDGWSLEHVASPEDRKTFHPSNDNSRLNTMLKAFKKNLMLK